MLSMAATIAYFVLSLSNLLLSDAYAVFIELIIATKEILIFSTIIV